MNLTQKLGTTIRIQHWLNLIEFRHLRWPILAAILLVSAAIPFAVPARWLILLMGLVPGIAFLLFILNQPALGIFIVVLGGAFVPFSGPGGVNVAVLGVGFMIGIWIFKMIVGDRRIHIIFSRVNVSVVVFIVISLISFLSGRISWYIYANQAPIDAQLGGLAIFILSAGVILFMFHQVNDQRWLEWLTWLFIIMVGLFIIGWLVPVIGRITDRLYDVGLISNSMFWTWAMAITFSQAVFNHHLRPIWRALMFCVFLGVFYVGFVQNYGWKSGWLPPLVAVAALVVLRYPRMGLFLIPFGLLGFWYLSTQAIATDEYSYSTRIDAWLIVLQIVKANPILGLGFANYYEYTLLFPIRGWYVRFNSHSQYIDILAQTGILGLVGFLWIFFELGLIGWRLRQLVPEGFAQAYVYGALGGLVGTLTAAAFVDWVLPFAYNIGMSGFRGSVLAWLFLGGMVSLDQIYRRKVRSE